jgi:TonB family protein
MRQRWYQRTANTFNYSASGAWAVLLLVCLPVASQTTAGEYQVKAAYLYNFAKTTQWPSEVLPYDSALIIGVFGGDEDFVKVLREMLSGKIVNSHTLEIRRLRSPEELKFCHLVFIRSSETNTRRAIEQVANNSVLLVGEDKKFLSEGGMINLELEHGKIAYEVNAGALERAGVSYGDSNSTKTQSAPGVPEVRQESSRAIAFRVMPEYPRIAASLNIVGAVQLQAVVRADGTVKQVRVIGGHPALAEAAAAAVMRWRYEPAAKETTETVKITFAD